MNNLNWQTAYNAGKRDAEQSYKAAWEAMYKPLSWMHDNPDLKAYWGWNLADIANDPIDRAYPDLRKNEAGLK